ncbi:NifU family protein [[Mycoplasma] testudinis]|uniref:NifU family protein n=1 Tax=[Mycoplasma] testudinis TaxID=33924 RepID=UPI0006984A23|nr:NifU family protein [[Mycoplasma] testudinis]
MAVKRKTKKEIEAEILDVLDNVRFYIQKDGGDLRFLKFENGIVHIQILGSCVGCALIDMTYKEGVETILQDEIKEVKGVNIVEPEYTINQNMESNILAAKRISPFKKNTSKK